MSEKSPFGNYTPEQIFAFEADSFIIIAGYEVFNANGRYIFTERSAVRHYNKILAEMVYQLENGTKKERFDAKRVLSTLRITPLRIH